MDKITRADFLKMDHSERLKFIQKNKIDPGKEVTPEPQPVKQNPKQKPAIFIIEPQTETQKKDNAKRIREIKRELDRYESEVSRLIKGIKKLKGNIQWQENRSRQARTICERGY